MPVNVRIVLTRQYSDYNHWEQGREAIVSKLNQTQWEYTVEAREE